MAAGKGTRLSVLTKNFNKALLPLGYKAAISHIIEKFPKQVEIIIAVGHEKKKICEYLSCAHNDRKIKIVEVDKISGNGAGPGYSLLLCKNFLNCPFIFFSVDTIVEEKIPIPDHNWMGISQADDASEFCSVFLKDNLINQIFDKVKTDNKNVFIGLAGIYDYNTFFKHLEKNESLINGERQVSSGFQGLIQKKIYSKYFSWNDLGSINGYAEAKKKFSVSSEAFNFEKINEYLYFIDDKVIKYFNDKEIIRKRYLRSKILNGLCPKINFKTDHFYCYKKIKGDIIYNSKNPAIFEKLLDWLNINLWKEIDLSKTKKNSFKDRCGLFYFNKTYNRLKNYYNYNNLKDEAKPINGVKIDTVGNLLSKIDQKWLSDGIPTGFHGDLQFENILFSENNNFNLIDWRQDFAGNIEYGDIYYDLAKLNGGIEISYKKIKQNLFSYEEKKQNILLSYKPDSFLKECKNILNKYIEKKNFDRVKIEIITGIIYLNMAAMHHEPFNHFIYHLGRDKIYKWINLK